MKRFTDLSVVEASLCLSAIRRIDRRAGDIQRAHDATWPECPDIVSCIHPQGLKWTRFMRALDQLNCYVVVDWRYEGWANRYARRRAQERLAVNIANRHEIALQEVLV